MPQSKQPTDGFRIRLDNDTIPPDREAPFTARDSARLDKLGRRIALVSIVIPLLVGVVLFLAYTDVKRRLSQTKTAGSAGVVSLSKDLESRFSNLSIKQAKLEETQKSTSAGVEKTLADIQKRLADAETVQKAKVDAKSLADTSEKLQQSIDRKVSALEKQLSRISKLETELARISKLKKELAGISKLETDLARLDTSLKSTRSEAADALEKSAATASQMSAVRSEIVKMGSGKVDRQTLQKAIAKEKTYYTESFNQLNRSLDEAIDSIDYNRKNIDISQGKLIELQRRLRDMEKRLSGAKAAPSSAPKPPRAGTKPPLSAENISEQSIKPQMSEKK